MESKIQTTAMAFALATATALLVTAPASAEQWHRGFGATAADVAAGAVGGVVAAAAAPLWVPGNYYDGYYPDYTYAPSYAYESRYHAYSYAPLYGYYHPYAGDAWSYRGGPHPR